ncbi:MAG: FAD-dependent oxidoreductase [Firmicutes bacterium]|nr:FAD-dependent oxidoreductase [Bacillota bacterium]
MIERIRHAASEAFPGIEMTLTVDGRNIVTVQGECESWNQLVDVGHFLAKQEGVKNVVNEMTVKGLVIPKKDYSQAKADGEAKGVVKETDVVIVGAGVIGCGIARTLAKYDMNVTVVEMSDDVCTGASKANNGNIHPGMAVKPGTLKAKLNIEGNRMYQQWADELNFALDWCGCVAVVTDERLMKGAEMTYKIAVMNGVHEPEVFYSAERALEIEPKLAHRNLDIKGGAFFPSFGQVESYEVVIALAENAADNGVEFMFNTTVADVLREDGQVQGVVTNKGIIKAKHVINCAGIYADEISAMAGDKCYTIHGRKGTLAILDRHSEPEFDRVTMIYDGSHLIQEKKNAESKGGAMCVTTEHQSLLGPSATEVPDKEDNTTTIDDLAYAMGTNLNAATGYKDIIKTFCGVRPADYSEDFVIEMSPITHGFINVGAIQSPGLASAPAIAKMVEEIWLEDVKAAGCEPAVKEDYNPYREARVEFRHMSREEQDQLIAQDPRYGRIICRCEQITEGEILDAINSSVVPTSVDAIKRRTRAGMGRCQGGFCQPKVLEILARELGKEWTEIHLKDAGSRILFEETRQAAKEGGDK